ncbi:nuclear transport factor 2 family protein [Devosia honganensis]|uniref:Nuclear transport factor 2 family protein n=1 Tax=Devosia honganensis TaxID=1610527 RepID=A0ABV7X3P7_9HYPH
MDEAVRKLFERYESGFNRALAGTIDMDEIASLYAAEFIASAPMGVRAGRNDAEFRQVMEQGYAHYRTIGTRRMSIRELRLSPIDALHCIAHVGWTAVYARQDEADISIDFEVHYLVRMQDAEPKVFGWVSGDEQQLLKQYGIV